MLPTSSIDRVESLKMLRRTTKLKLAMRLDEQHGLQKEANPLLAAAPWLARAAGRAAPWLARGAKAAWKGGKNLFRGAGSKIMSGLRSAGSWAKGKLTGGLGRVLDAVGMKGSAAKMHGARTSQLRRAGATARAKSRRLAAPRRLADRIDGKPTGFFRRMRSGLADRKATSLQTRASSVKRRRIDAQSAKAGVAPQNRPSALRQSGPGFSGKVPEISPILPGARGKIAPLAGGGFRVGKHRVNAADTAGAKKLVGDVLGRFGAKKSGGMMDTVNKMWMGSMVADGAKSLSGSKAAKGPSGYLRAAAAPSSFSPVRRMVPR